MKLVAIFILLLILAIIIAGYDRNYAGGKDYIKNIAVNPASMSENMARKVFEDLFRRDFPTILPDWLQFAGSRMELDGYAADIGVAFEYQGPQHYKFDHKMDATKQEFLERLAKDAAKVKMCAERGILLIVVDYRLPRYLYSNYIKSRVYDYFAAYPSRYAEMAQVYAAAIPYWIEDIHSMIAAKYKPGWYAERTI